MTGDTEAVVRFLGCDREHLANGNASHAASLKNGSAAYL
jgi:hypothetical protein